MEKISDAYATTSRRMMIDEFGRQVEYDADIYMQVDNAHWEYKDKFTFKVDWDNYQI